MGRLEDALGSYLNATQVNPNDAQLWMRIGIAQAKLSKLPEAVESLDRSISLDSTNNRAWLNRAALLEKLGDDEEALRSYDTVIGNEPQDKYAWSGKGRILMKMDKLDHAKRSFDRALELDPQLESAVEGNAALDKKLKQRQISIYAARVLEYEQRRNAKVTREEAFKDCGLPFSALDEVTAYLQAKEPVDVEGLDEERFHAYEVLSHDVLMATLGNPNYQRQGLRLADVYMSMPDRDVVKAKKVMSYIETVNKMDFAPEAMDKKTEKMVRAALDLPSDAHSTLGVMQNLEVGLYTARRIMSMLNNLNGGASAPRQYQVARERAPARPEAPQAPFARERGRSRETVAPADIEGNNERQEVRPMFKRKKREEAAPARPVDRSKAVTVTYQQESSQYHGRKCLFHGEAAVSVCPSCGTLFCMDCVTNLDICPRCQLAIDFVDGATIGKAVDDRDLIETEAQRKAIQQRWAMKRLAEADRTSAAGDKQLKAVERELRAARPAKDKMVEKLVQDSQKRYNAPPIQNAPKTAYRAAAESVEEAPPTLQEQIEMLQQDAPEPQIYQPASIADEAMPREAVLAEGEPMEAELIEATPAPEEILPEEPAPSIRKGEDRREKLRELLEAEPEPGVEVRDMSRL